MIKKLVMVISLVLMVVLVFGCSGAKHYSADRESDLYHEIDTVSLRDIDNGKNNTELPDPAGITVDPGVSDSSAIELRPGTTSNIKNNSSEESIRYYAKPSNKQVTKVTVPVYEDVTEFELGLYEIKDGAWTCADRAYISATDKQTLDLYYGLSYETPYYDLEAGTDITVPLYVSGEDIELHAALRKTGVRTFTYLFTEEYDTDSDIILAGYVFVSEQRHIMDEFDGSYFDNPEKLPDLGENGELFAITIKLKK